MLFSSISICALLSVSNLAKDCSNGDAGEDCTQCKADFAIYNPTTEEDGVWEEEVVALTTLFDTFGWTWEEVSATDINNGKLGTGDNRQYRGLVAPGGYAYYRNKSVSSQGEEYLRQFINDGGNYLGFCAGSFWASNIVSWAETATGNSGEYNSLDDYKDYDYDLNLFNETAKGPFGWTTWNAGTNASLEEVNINTNNSTMNIIGLPLKTRFFYYGGPFFTNTSNYNDLEVWATAKKPDNVSDIAGTGNNEPTIIRFSQGLGHVILFSYHPDILINSLQDGVKLSQYINEDNIVWQTGEQSQEDINYDSWNIVHAALQLSANESVTKM